MAQNQKPTVEEELKKEITMAKIDPKQYATSNFDNDGASQQVERKTLSPGSKFMVPTGAAHKKRNDKTVLELMFVCIEDLEGKNEEGAVHFETFWLTDRALFRISNWALAMGWEKHIDPDSLENIQDVMLHGGFVGVFQESTYNGKTRVELKWFNKAKRDRADNGSIEFSDEELEIIKQAEKAYPKMIKYRKENYGHEYITVGAQDGDNDESYDEIPF